MQYFEAALSPQPPSNPELVGVAVAALESANRRKQTLGDAHLVAPLLRIGSVADALAATGVDVARAREVLEHVLAALPRRPGPFTRAYEVFSDLRVALDPLHKVRAVALGAELTEITGPFALAAILGDPGAAELRSALEKVGFSLARFRSAVAHRGAVDAPCPAEGPVKVVFHNDPFTPKDFVVEVLTQVFERDPATAVALMERAHKEGHAELAVMDASFASPRVEKSRSRAERAEWPLRIAARPA